MKFAVMVAGPIRYVLSVIEVLETKKNIDLFIHIWSDDTGNKKRLDEDDADLLKLQSLSNVKYLFIAKPYTDNDFKADLSCDVELGQSNMASVLGMFISMNVLVNVVSLMPEKYKAVIRLRTDCLIMVDELFDDFPVNKEVFVSKNYLIPHEWVSDHIMAGSVESMLDIWGWDSIEELYRTYNKAKTNPELLLSQKIKRLGISVNEKWLRYRDYNIIYNPPKANDLSWIASVIENHGVKFLFENWKGYVDKDEIDSLLRKQKLNQDYYSLPKWKKVFVKLGLFDVEKML